MDRRNQIKKYLKMFSTKLGFLFFLVLCFSSSCMREKLEERATLLLSSVSNGDYEIYRVEDSFSFILAQKYLGSYNKKVSLPSGDYLLLTQCSSKRLVLERKEEREINLQSLVFEEPFSLEQEKKFSVTCQKHPYFQKKNKLENKFVFDFFPEKKTIWVNQQKLGVDFLKFSDKKPQAHKVSLSAVRVMTDKKLKKSHYFILSQGKEPKTSLSQELNQWSFLVPGDYELEINGTKKKVKLSEGQGQSFTVGFLKPRKSSQLKQNDIIQKWGHPLSLYLDGSHMIFFGEKLPVFPGDYSLNFSRSSEKKSFIVKPGEVTEVNYNTVFVKSGCQSKKDRCLQQKEVLLYNKEDKTPFLEGHADIALPYFTDSVGVEFKSSRHLKYWLSENKKSQVIKMANLTLKPTYIFNPDFTTELVRLEAENTHITGFSQDIPYNRTTTMDLVSGRYNLVSYLKSKKDGEKRSRVYHKVRLSPYQKREKVFPFYLSKSQYLKLKREKKL